MSRGNAGRGPGRHRHTVTVRDDGLGAVLGRLGDDRSVAAVLLVEVASGMVLDAHHPPGADAEFAEFREAEVEALGARYAEIVRAADPHALSLTDPRGLGLLRVVPDPHGDMVLAATLRGAHSSGWRRYRIRRLLDRVPEAALTAGPTTHLRPTSTDESIAWIPPWTQTPDGGRSSTPDVEQDPARALPVLPAPPPPSAPDRS